MKCLFQFWRRSPPEFTSSFGRADRGAIAPIAAVLMTVLLLTAGAGIDLGRQAQLEVALQDAADSAALAGVTQPTSAAAVASAAAYVAAARARITGAPVINNPTYAYDNTTNPGAPTMTVTLSASIPTTLLSVLKPSLSAAATATATGSLMRKVTVTINNVNSAASDLDQIYYYTYSSSLSGTQLYQFVPTLSSSNLVMSNATANAATYTFNVPYGYSVGFALANTTGGRSGYGSNCYGQAQGATVTYYSHRETSAGTYYDYPSVAFKTCTGTAYSNSTLSNCSGGYGCYGGGTSVPAANYIYAAGYSRNPLQYSTANQDCTKGTVGYQWDDNGGAGSDDNDYNDYRFNVACQPVAINNAAVKLTQ